VNSTPVAAKQDFLLNLRDALRQFAEEREWGRFHTPKNLAISLCVEAAELLEHYQWLSETESVAIPPETKAKVSEEIADVLIYLVQIADKLDVDLKAAAIEKLRLNAAKYPIDKARGNSKKYTEL
jgi:dCTP diphosphatase